MAVSKRLRFEILRRDNHTCRYCGATANDGPLTVDHVVPVALGGTDEPSNLVAACRDCNSGKAASAPDSVLVAAVAENAAELVAAKQQATEQRAGELAEVVEFVECVWTATWVIDPEANDTSTQYRHPGRYYAPRPGNWEQSIHHFHDGGLDVQFQRTAAANTLRHAEHVSWDDKWRYFCGICWRELDTRRDMAFKSLDKQGV